MVLVVDKNDAGKARDILLKAGHAPRVIGEIVTGDAGVELL